MISSPTAQANTGLSPEWDRWFDEVFTDLISSDDELVQAEFEDLVASSWQQPPPPPAPPAPSTSGPADHPDPPAGSGSDRPEPAPETPGQNPRPPP